MKIKINREELVKKVNVSANVMAVKSPMVALTGLKIDVDKENDRIVLTTSDGNMSLRNVVSKGSYEISESGSALVNGKMFQTILRGLSAKDISAR